MKSGFIDQARKAFASPGLIAVQIEASEAAIPAVARHSAERAGNRPRFRCSPTLVAWAPNVPGEVDLRSAFEVRIGVRRVDVVLSGDADQGEECVAPGIGQRRSRSARVAVSPIAQIGHSDESHSPDEWASVVVRWMSPASPSIAVV
jgi:hypothetical protein